MEENIFLLDNKNYIGVFLAFITFYNSL